MKTLLLCRHAKSSWKDLSLTDRERPLNKRGKRDAPDMGNRVRERGVKPDAIVASPAKRTQRTAKHLARALEYPVGEIQTVEYLYGGGPSSILHVLRSLDDALQTVMLVGHNPETTMVANLLGDLSIDNVPTCGIVALEFSFDQWRKVQAGSGTLAWYDYPKKKP